jgi:hypothetical protein
MTAITDPVAMIDQLEPDAIRQRIADLDRQSRALRVLLRAAIAREREVLQALKGRMPAVATSEGQDAH